MECFFVFWSLLACVWRSGHRVVGDGETLGEGEHQNPEFLKFQKLLIRFSVAQPHSSLSRSSALSTL